MTKLIYPTLNLFLYDLREGFGQTLQQIEQNRQQFIQKLPETLDQRRFIQRDDNSFEPEYLELLDKRIEPLSLPENHTDEDYYYPVRLSDTYALLLDASLKETQSDEDLTWLKDLHVLLKTQIKNQTGTLGQTWLFSAQLPDLSFEQYEALAKRCYEQLIPDALNTQSDPEHSDFLGGHLFEFSRYSNVPRENEHLLIIFYPDKSAAEKGTLFYPDWLSLWMYHHKMRWAYQQSRWLKKRLKEKAIDIQNCHQAVTQHSRLPLDLKSLQKTLHSAWELLPRYTTDLSGLDDQTRTIEINLENYDKRLNTLRKKTQEEALKLEQFSELVRYKYLRQVQKDHANLSPTLTSLENLIGYIQTMVAIEEEKRERAFQGTIATWGIGLAAGAIVASVSGQFPTDYEAYALTRPLNVLLVDYLHLPVKWVVPSMSVILSISAAFIAGLVTKMVIGLRRR
jgi:hypothetical protein